MSTKASKTAREELKEIAERIHRHLKRFESNKTINAADPIHKTRPYYFTYVEAIRGCVYVTYITYQGPSKLSRNEAERYLRWLDEGTIGKHYAALSDGAQP